MTSISNTHNDDSTISTSGLPWLPLAPGITIKLIKTNPQTDAHTILIRASPGGILPPHRHLDSAEIFILRGAGEHPQAGPFREGDYITEHKGAVHSALVFEVETEMLMIAQGASVFLDEEGKEVYRMDVAMLKALEARTLGAQDDGIP